MPTIHENTPRDAFTIAGEVFHAFHPYAEGHPLTANEAASLNQTFTENVRNNFAAKIKEQKEANAFDHASTQAALDEYMRVYEFGVRRGGGGGRTGDPVMTRAMELARDAVRKKIKEVGGNFKDYSAADITARARKAVEANPKFFETAKRHVEDEKGIQLEEMDSLPTEEKAKSRKTA